MISFLTMTGEGWSAVVHHAPPHETGGLWHVYATTDGESRERALEAAQWVFDVFTQGRLTVVRAGPEVASETNFDTKAVRHAGFVRFSYRFTTGDHFHVDALPPIGLGTTPRAS